MPLKLKLSPAIMAVVILMPLVMIVTLFSIPLIQQTQIHVVIDENVIADAWIETPTVSAISTLFKPSKKVGIYSIDIKIEETNETFMLENVPANEYVIIWREALSWTNDGIPPSGTYTIKIDLKKQGLIVHQYTLPVTF